MINTISALPAFSDNYIWALVDNDQKRLCVVDPGDPAPVIQFIETNALTLECLLITHHHPDHTGGIAALVEKYGCTVYGPHNPSITGIEKRLNEGDTFSVLGEEVCVLEVPGHTLDHIAYFVRADGDRNVPTRLFSGDTLFAAGCGRLFEGTPEQMLTSLNKLVALGDDTQVYCTHEYTQANLKFANACEPENDILQQRTAEVAELRAAGKITLPTSIKVERATNPFLRSAQPSLYAAAKSFTGSLPLDDVSTFSAIRAWKDEF